MLTRLRWFALGVVATISMYATLRNASMRDRVLRAARAGGQAAVTSAMAQLRQG